MCVFGSGWRGWREGCVDESISFGLYQSCRNRGSVGRESVFWLRWCGGVGSVGEEWVGGLDQRLEGWGGLMSV